MWKKRRPHLLKIKLYSTRPRVYPVHANTKGILIECCNDQKFISEMYGQESQTQQIKRKNNTFTERCVREYELQLSPGWGDSAYERGGDARRKFGLNPRDRSGRGPSVFCPLKETTRIYISNIYFYIFSCTTLNETFTAKFDGVLPRTP